MARYLVAYGFLTRGAHGEVYQAGSEIKDADRVTPEQIKVWEQQLGRPQGHSGTCITGFFKLDDPE